LHVGLAGQANEADGAGGRAFGRREAT